ncbi:MAG: helix-hairpin-helix domain-containing protein [Desulfobulbaceae bacterium]|nr:helix-hairpin-helix domain-containing protein [Desulfobulbaceae bacterium]
METTRGTRRDSRMLALVLFGVCLCLPHLYRALFPAVWPDPPQKNLRLVWLETPALHGDGLYLLDLLSDAWLSMPVAAALHSLVEPFPAGVVSSPLAYHLQVDGAVRRISPPARVSPVFFQPIPINLADLDTLMVIPGIGKRLAQAILDYREEEGRIVDRDALLAVEGIGKKKAAVIAGYVRFD